MNSNSSRLSQTLARYERTLREFAARRGARTSGAPLPPVSAWLLDNYAYLHRQLREIREALPRGYYRHLPRENGATRIERLTAELVALGAAEVSVESIREYFLAQQEDTVLTLAEIWAIGPMLKVALLDVACRAAAGEALEEAAIRTAVVSLRRLDNAPWRDLTESLSAVDRILREDPAGVYGRMDFATRDDYRHAVEQLALDSRLTEPEIAALAVALARESGDQPHVGYYLAGRGAALLKKSAGYRSPWGSALRSLAPRFPNTTYFGATAVLLALLLGSFRRLLDIPWWWLPLLLLPAAHAAILMMNQLLIRLIPPRRTPRLDFSQEIPRECRTFVVVPTLLLSRAGVQDLMNSLEIQYLANRDPNLLFALLTDFGDSPTPTGPRDWLADVAADGIRSLNERHGQEGHSPFYLFHRHRDWNPSEGVWMGYERKRGKLADFNGFLLGEDDAFDLKIGDLAAIGNIRYVITLDTDTQLPRDTAQQLIAAMAHPLNRPVLDTSTGTVREGHALLQPRISISMESAARSRLAQIFSGETGFDPYTTAVSDLYQDLWGQASFTGKGIYDLQVLHAALRGRFPENTLLSHDLLEGEHVRTGFVADLEMIDDYPATCEAWSKRKHRWARGDWQIARWMLPRVPDFRGRRVNPLGVVSRWKIFDNLRRSLLDISFVAAFLAGWFAVDGSASAWTLATLACLALPVWIDAALAFTHLPPARFWGQYSREVGWRFARGHGDALLHLVFQMQQACLMADAIGRTLVRCSVTHRHKLEWESAAEAEVSTGRGAGLHSIYLLASPVLALAVAFIMSRATTAAALPMLILELWIFAPLVAAWLNGRPRKARELAAADHQFLHDVALRTWRYFADYGRAGENWLIPDNVQEDPASFAHRASPTNIGLLLNAQLAARDFGFLTTGEMAGRLDRTLDTMLRLERCRGHFYNWYDTRSLAAFEPRFVSSVDSGNLAASLITVKQGCLERLKAPVLEPPLLAGLRDHTLRLRASLPPAERTSAVMRMLAGLLRQLDYSPTDFFFWESVLTEAAHIVRRLDEHRDSAGESTEPGRMTEPCYWYRALAERMDAALAELYALAPWLALPLELELRLATSDASLADVLSKLARVPAIEHLPAQYDAIATAIGARLAAPEPLHARMRHTLEQVLAGLDPPRAFAAELIERLERNATVASGFVREMDFAFLLDRRRKLMHVGYDATADRLEESCYDLLASEARTAVFLAIAKGDLPREAWFRLGRKLTSYRGHRTLLSWSGTMFEYLMPGIFMETYENTLLGESLREMVGIQQLYGRERHVPWGISESASNARDSAQTYQYAAFGIPHLGIQQRYTEELVIAPYATLLALQVDRTAATANLRLMASRGWLARHGFYEAVDYSSAGAREHRGFVVVRCFMAHHQGMGLMALTNLLLDGAMRSRFHAEPMVQATGYLLQERSPAWADTRPEERLLPVETAASLQPAGRPEAF